MKFKIGNILEIARMKDEYAIIIINGRTEREGVDTLGRTAPTGIWQYEATILKSTTGMFFGKPIGQQLTLSIEFVDKKGKLLSNEDCEWARLFF